MIELLKQKLSMQWLLFALFRRGKGPDPKEVAQLTMRERLDRLYKSLGWGEDRK
ncbi:MAG TPA: hypothetical protein VKW08_07765 [Xanthobacteraceae bacterium]|nr:hypothetical protein [Xanthobacteraceae bacterium]